MIIQQNGFKYTDCSNNIFTKIQLVNALTKKEMGKLNEEYAKLGLFIKQVEVDNYGNEIYSDDLFGNSFISKKRRLKKHRMTLQEFYEKYYLRGKIKKNSQNKKNNRRISNSNNLSENSDEEEDNEEYLANTIEYLKEICEDCQNIEMKKCTIKDERFKKTIIYYINTFSKYLTVEQYNNLLIKWKNKNMEIKGFNIFSDLNDLNNWGIPVLKAFKSEIALLASINILRKQNGEDISIAHENFEGDKNIEKNDEDKSDDSLSEEKSESNSSKENFFNNQNVPINKEDNSENEY